MNEMIPGRTKMNFTLRVLSHPVVYLREMQPMCALRDRWFAKRGKFAGHWPVCVLCVELNTYITFCVPQDEKDITLGLPTPYNHKHFILFTSTIFATNFVTSPVCSKHRCEWQCATALNSATRCRMQSGTVQFNNWSPLIALQTRLCGVEMSFLS